MLNVKTVNPAQVQSGQSILTHDRHKNSTRKVKSVGVCPSSPECVHLDHECYDTRFATVDLVVE